MGEKSMEQHIHKFLELLRYVDYMKDERVNIQSFLRNLPLNYWDRIQFVNPLTLDEAIRMEMHCYEQEKGKSKVQPTWKGKWKGRFDQRKSGFKTPPFRNQLRNF